MYLSRLDIAVFVSYLLAVLLVGMLAARRGSSTKRDYFLSGDKLPWWMIGGSIVASNVSSHHLVGIMGTAYSRGFAAMWIVWGTVLIGFNALLWVFLPYYLRNGFYTMPEFLQRRYGAGARLTYVVLVLITYIFVEVSSVLYLGALSAHALLNVDVMTSVVILALATAVEAHHPRRRHDGGTADYPAVRRLSTGLPRHAIRKSDRNRILDLHGGMRCCKFGHAS